MLFQFTLENIPNEMLENICRFLEPNEVATLRTICRGNLCISASSSTIWLSYLKRLKALDNKISVEPPKENQEGWCYRRFVEEFNRIAQSQQEKIQNFHEREPLTVELHFKLSRKSRESYNIPTTLKALEKRHEILNNLSRAMMKKNPIRYTYSDRTRLFNRNWLYDNGTYEFGFIPQNRMILRSPPSSSLPWKVTGSRKKILRNNTNLDENNQNGDDNNYSNNSVKKLRNK